MEACLKFNFERTQIFVLVLPYNLDFSPQWQKEASMNTYKTLKQTRFLIKY